MHFSGLCLASSIAFLRSGLYSIVFPGSYPQYAYKIIFALQSSILLASSFAAKPPKTTEWTAPILAHPSIAIAASGIIGI